MDASRNYYPYFVTKDGEEWTDSHSYEINIAYEEALRHKAERNPVDAGIKVFDKGCFKILNWREGRYWKGNEHYLYRIHV